MVEIFGVLTSRGHGATTDSTHLRRASGRRTGFSEKAADVISRLHHQRAVANRRLSKCRDATVTVTATATTIRSTQARLVISLSTALVACRRTAHAKRLTRAATSTRAIRPSNASGIASLLLAKASVFANMNLANLRLATTVTPDRLATAATRDRLEILVMLTTSVTLTFLSAASLPTICPP